MLRECAREKWKLTYPEPDDFTVCCWQKRPGVLPVWVAYRFVAALYFYLGGVVILLHPEDETHPFKQLILVAFWCYILEIIAFTLAFGIVVAKYLQQKKDPSTPPKDKMPPHFQFLWCLIYIIGPAAVVIAVVFWIIVFDPDEDTNIPNYVAINVFSLVFVLLDFALAAYPYRVVHFYMPLSFAVIYTTFGAIYQVCGGVGFKGQIPIYKRLDWRYPDQAFSACAVELPSIVLVHFSFCVLSTLKNWVKRPRE